MADVFLSYARENRPEAERLASALESERWSVWWDRTTAPGQAFAKLIQQQVKDARCVVVLWSLASIESDWVFNEAETGRRRGVLIPALIEQMDPSDIPLVFQHLQTANLINWSGDQSHTEYRALISAVESLVTRNAPQDMPPKEGVGIKSRKALDRGQSSPHQAPSEITPSLAPTTRDAASRAPSPPVKKAEPVAAPSLSSVKATGPGIANLEQILGLHLSDPKARARAVGDFCLQHGDARFRLDAWFLPGDPNLGFIEIPAGPFTMGSDKKKDEGAFDDEQPAHSVTLPAFYIARFPVTVAQVRAFAEDKAGNGGFTPGDLDCLRGVANHPVVNVSWHEALAYCDWLRTKLAAWPETSEVLARVLRPTRKADKSWRVTLASEAEWEKAARGTDGRIYPWGAQPDPNKANYGATGIGGTSAVGCFPSGASPYSVEDMCGNVWEWTRSLWGKYPYKPGPKHEDPKAGNKKDRVVRGGAFVSGVGHVRAASRRGRGPDLRLRRLGFRVVVSPFFSEL